MPFKSANQNYLYEHQYSDWLKLQVRLLKTGRAVEADVDHIAQELEDIGSEAEAKLSSLIRQAMVNLCKIEFARDQTRADQWMVEIANFRAEIEDRILNRFSNDEDLVSIYDRSWKTARSILMHALTREELKHIPKECPYAMGQIRDEQYFPVPHSKQSSDSRN